MEAQKHFAPGRHRRGSEPDWSLSHSLHGMPMAGAPSARTRRGSPYRFVIAAQAIVHTRSALFLITTLFAIFAPAPRRMRVLIIEDSPKMANLLERALGEEGYAVDLALTGADGLWLGCE